MIKDSDYKPLVDKLKSAKKIIFEGALVHLIGDAVAVLGPCLLGLEPNGSEVWWNTYFLNGYVPLQVLAGVIMGAGAGYAERTIRNHFRLRGHHAVDFLDCACERDTELQARKREYISRIIKEKGGEKAERQTRRFLELLINKPEKINLILTDSLDLVCSKCAASNENCYSKHMAGVDSKEIRDAGFEAGRPYNGAEIKSLFLNNPDSGFLPRRILHPFWYGVGSA